MGDCALICLASNAVQADSNENQRSCSERHDYGKESTWFPEGCARSIRTLIHLIPLSITPEAVTLFERI